MKDLTTHCNECDGWGKITIEHNGTEIPYLQNIVDYECMSCSGTGEQIDSELVKELIEDIEWMIEGMQTRMRMHSDFIMQLKKGYLHELANKYNDRLDTCSRALGRLMNYKRKLYNLVAN
jgi:DnaJ-domain-containing protein 1